jgi:hypothetical protein
VSSRTAKATQRNPVSKNQKRKKKKRRREDERMVTSRIFTEGRTRTGHV